MASHLFEKVIKARGPGKRQIKPAKFGLNLDDIPDFVSTSSDDVDFEVGVSDLESGRSDSEVRERGSGASQGSKSSNSTHQDDEQDSSANNESESEIENQPKPRNKARKPANVSKAAAKSSKSQTRAKRAKLVEPKQSRKESNVEPAASDKTICCVCLRPSERNELLNCTCCHIKVHATCYRQRSAPEENSWLCAVCELERAARLPVCNRLGNVNCELCPATGGAYFRSTESASRFVHVVCALYTPEVRLQSERKTSTPSAALQEAFVSRRGAPRACALCEDLRYSWTGLPIGCDAGLCRTAFHATCAQRSGLLVEPGEAAENVAYCKLHSNPEDARRRKRAFAACLGRFQAARDGALLHVPSGFGQHAPASVSVPASDEGARWLHSNASLVRRFYRKAALLERELPTAALPTCVTSDEHARGVRCVRKTDLHLAASAQQLKANSTSTLPSFTPGFVERYFERNAVIADEYAKLAEATAERQRLSDRENLLREQYDSLASSVSEARTRSAQLCDELCQLRNVASGLSLHIEDSTISEALNEHSTRRVRDSVAKQPAEQRRGGAKRRRVCDGASDGSASASTAAAALAADGRFRSCAVCSRSSGQHLLAECDTCRLCYHLACLEPPLSRMPKKSRIYGWQCSRCTVQRACDSDDEKSGANVDVNQPRQLRHAHALAADDTDSYADPNP